MSGSGGGQTGITEFDIFDAREPFRPGILFGTGTAGLSADMIPISDNSGLYTGSTVEAALDQIGFDGARVSKVYQSDFEATALSSDAEGNLTVQGTGTFTIPASLIHAGDTDTKIDFEPDEVAITAGDEILLRLTETAQDLVEMGDVSGVGDVDINFNGGQALLRGSDGFFGFGTTDPGGKFHVLSSDASSPTWLAADVFIIERSGSTRLQIHGSDSSGSGVWFTDTVRGQGRLEYNHATDQLSFYASGSQYMRVNSNGVVAVGQGTVSSKLFVRQESTTFAEAVMTLDQEDVDEPFIHFVGEAAAANLTRSIVDEGDVTTATRIGWVKISIDDVGNQVTDGDYYVPFYTLA